MTRPPRAVGALTRAGAAAVALLVLAAACLTRVTSEERTESEFWSTVSGMAEQGARELGPEARADLIETLPEAEDQPTWRGVLDILDERSSLEPLADRIEAFVDSEIDASVRTELLTPSGDGRLRELILSSIKNGLTGP